MKQIKNLCALLLAMLLIFSSCNEIEDEPPEKTNAPVDQTTAQTNPPESSNSKDKQYPLEVPQGYSVTDSVGFEMLTSSADGTEHRMTNVIAALLASEENKEPAIFVELRSYDDKTITDTIFEEGRGMIFLSKNSAELILFNTEITSAVNMDGYAQIVKYTVINGEFYESTEFFKKTTYFRLYSGIHLEDSRIDAYNMFIDFSEELERQDGALVILDTYTSDTPMLYAPSANVIAPDIIEDGKNGKTTWSIDRIAEVNGYVKKDENLPENKKTYETEDGWLISGMSAQPGLYRVVGCTDKIAKNATVPTKFNGYDIIILDHGALQNCRAETLTIPAGLERVELQQWGDSIKKLIIECDDSTVFEKQCFMGLPIEEVIFTGNKTVIERELFYLCKNLKKVTLPASLETISRMAFQGCTSLEAITLPEGIQSIQQNAFYGCESLKEITLPKSLVNLEDYAFACCYGLTSITILSEITELKYGVFWKHGCETIRIPEGIEKIEDTAITGDSLKYIELPSTLKKIVTYFIDLHTSPVEEIYYNGTCEEWNKIEKSQLYGSEYNKYTVHCTDGKVDN